MKQLICLKKCSNNLGKPKIWCLVLSPYRLVKSIKFLTLDILSLKNPNATRSRLFTTDLTNFISSKHTIKLDFLNLEKFLS